MAGTRGVDAKLAGRKGGGGQAEAGRGEDPAGELSTGTAPDRAIHAAGVVVGWCASDHGAHDIRRPGRVQSGKPQSRLATAIRWTIASGAATGPAAVSAPAEARVARHKPGASVFVPSNHPAAGDADPAACRAPSSKPAVANYLFRVSTCTTTT